MARGSLLMSLLLMAVSIPAGAALHDIPEGYVRVAEQHGVPAEVLLCRLADRDGHGPLRHWCCNEKTE